MSTFSEADVQRHYDLLQHNQDLGLTQLKAMVGILSRRFRRRR